MKNKFFIILFLLFLFSPLYSSAYFYNPKANLTIVVNTNVQEGNFNFKILSNTYTCASDETTGVWGCFYTPLQDYQNFSLQTDNLTGTKDFLAIPTMREYKISEEILPGYRIDSVGCTSDIPGSDFTYQEDGAEMTLQDRSNTVCVFNNKKIIDKTPVLIVPGLLGTEMKKVDEKLWVNPKMANPFNDDSFMDPLQFSNDLVPVDDQVATDKIVGAVEIKSGDINFSIFDYSDGLINEFKNQGYVEGETLFTFPYDWRYGVSGKFLDGTTNADLLAQKIKDILTETGADKVDVVAHSMGGLIVKKYVMDNLGDSKIGKAIFVGVPNTGAPKAVKVLLQGDNFGVVGLNDEEMKKISENMPAAYDLLPSQQYYDSSFISTVNIGNLTNPKNEEKDLNYTEAKSYLIDGHKLNSLAETNAENLHTADFDNFDLRTAGVDMYAINGCKTPTIAQMAEITGEDSSGSYSMGYDILKETSGDGTVPFGSADSVLANDNNVFYAVRADHGKMPSANGIRQEIVNLISGSNLDAGSNIITKETLSADNSKCQLNGHLLKLFSPVSIEVVDQSGNRSGVATDGNIQNNIPGADYEIIGEHKFVFIPTDENQTYTISLKGEGNGTYTFKSSKIDNGQTITTEVFSDLPVTTDLTGQVILADSGTTLSVKQNASSAPVIVVADELKPKPAPVEEPPAAEPTPAPVTAPPAPTVSGGGGMPTLAPVIVPTIISKTEPFVAATEPKQNPVSVVIKKVPSKIIKPVQKEIAKVEAKQPALPEISQQVGAASLADSVKKLGFLDYLKSFGRWVVKILFKK